MKTIHTIALFASVLVVAMGTITLNGISATPLMTVGASQTNDIVGMLGHVEYAVRDSEGFMKAYMQTDNIVVETGKDCVARLVFENSTDPGKCNNENEFQHIAIGNFTVTGSAVNATMTHLDDADSNNADCAETGSSGGAEMARKTVTVAFQSATGGTGTVVTLDTSVGNTAFTFDANNATTVYQSGVFDAGEAAASEVCSGTPPASNLFSIQDLNADTGISVNNGDSLSVKWTITVG